MIPVFDKSTVNFQAILHTVCTQSKETFKWWPYFKNKKQTKQEQNHQQQISKPLTSQTEFVKCFHFLKSYNFTWVAAVYIPLPFNTSVCIARNLHSIVFSTEMRKERSFWIEIYSSQEQPVAVYYKKSLLQKGGKKFFQVQRNWSMCRWLTKWSESSYDKRVENKFWVSFSAFFFFSFL